jgi:hypothetical protein
VLLIVLDTGKESSCKEGIESGASKIELKVRHAIDLIFYSGDEVNSVFCEGSAVAFGENGRSWSKIFNARWIAWIALVGIRENGKNIWPIFPQNLLELSVSIDLLGSVVFVEVVTPSPLFNRWGSRYRRDHPIQRVRAESVRIVQKHYQFEYGLFMFREVDERAL